MSATLKRPYFAGPQTPDTGAMRNLDALARGELWTRQGLLRQSSFLQEYTGHPKRQAAWLMGLAACVANDDSTHALLEQAIARGLPLEDAAHLAVFSDSRAATAALAGLGVDWTRQEILPHHADLAGARPTLGQPVEVFMEHAVDPDRAQSRYATDIHPQLALDVGFHAAMSAERPSGFLQGIVDAQVDCQACVSTQALGLASGQARVLSIAIANRAWPLVRAWMEQPLSQDTIDEALLSCAMLHKYLGELDIAGRMEWEFIAGALISRGANPDAPFQFQYKAAEQLHGYAGRFEQSRAGTARQWFLDGMLHQSSLDSFKWQPWFCPLPLPQRPGHETLGEYWCEWLSAASARSHGMFRPHAAVDRFMRFLVASQLPTHDDAREILEMAAENAGANRPELFDALLDTPALHLHGSVSPDQFTPLLRSVLGMGDAETWSDTVHAQAINCLWRNPRLDRMAQLLPGPAQESFLSQLHAFRTVIDALWPEVSPPMDFMSPAPRKRDISEQDMEALRMAAEACMAGFEKGLSPATRPRRSL